MNLKLPSLLKQPTAEVECERKLREVIQFLVEVLSVSFNYFFIFSNCFLYSVFLLLCLHYPITLKCLNIGLL